MGVQDRDWYHQRGRRAATVGLPRRAPLWLQVAIGVFIGSTAAALISWRVILWRAEVAATQLALETETAIRQVAADAQREQARQKRERDQRELARRADLAARQRTEERLRLEAAAERSRKDQAWGRYYRKPAACDDANGGAWSVGCANDFMRAKVRFDDLYDAGKLR